MIGSERRADDWLRVLIQISMQLFQMKKEEKVVRVGAPDYMGTRDNLYTSPQVSNTPKMLKNHLKMKHAFEVKMLRIT